MSQLDADDADDAFAAIRLANPAGLGKVETGDVTENADDHTGHRLTLIEAMHLARDRDRIANAYVTAYTDIFDFALPILDTARLTTDRDDLAISTLHMALLAEFPDSHIARKWGPETAGAVCQEARALRPVWSPTVTANTLKTLLDFDANLKSRGLNPGTTADFVVATLFTAQMSRQKFQ